MEAGGTPRFLTIDSHVLRGVRRLVNVAQPAAGAEWAIVVPGGSMWRIVGGRGQLTTSATVANRNPGVKYTQQGSDTSLGQSSGALAAGVVNGVVFYMPGTTPNPAAAQSGEILVPTPLSWLETGDIITSRTNNLQAADQYSNVVLLIEEAYFTNAALSIFEGREEEAVLELVKGK